MDSTGHDTKATKAVGDTTVVNKIVLRNMFAIK